MLANLTSPARAKLSGKRLADKRLPRKLMTHQLFRSILQSSFFLGFNAYSVILIFCLSRRFMGKFYYLFAAHVPATIGSYLSILLERKSRRAALSFYVANIASETVWNKLVHKGWVKPLPAGESILFALSAASFLYLIHSQGRYGKDPVSFAFKFLIGSDFLQQRASELAPQYTSTAGTNTTAECIAEASNVLEQQNRLEGIVEEIADRGSIVKNGEDGFTFACASCQHSQLPSTSSLGHLLLSPSIGTPSCLLNCLHGLLRNGLIVYSVNSLATLAFKPHKVISNPAESMERAFFSNDKSRRLALFVASFTAIFKASSCFFNRMQKPRDNRTQKSDRQSLLSPLPQVTPQVQTFISALLASSSMLLYRSPTVAQYMLWKLLETIYFRQVKAGNIKYVDFTLNMLYAASTAQLFYVAVMEPKMMRKSYTHWLNRVTKGSFALLNRNIIDVFGTESTFGYPIYFPEIDILQPQFVSEKFKESVLVWML